MVVSYFLGKIDYLYNMLTIDKYGVEYYTKYEPGLKDVVYIPCNSHIHIQQGYVTKKGIITLLKGYSTQPKAIRFISSMMDEA